jgi:hypothetical protein
MHAWRDFWRGRGLEILLLAYLIVWVTALLLARMLTK